jgi:hypothetical protein
MRLYDKRDVWAYFGVDFDKQTEIGKSQPSRRRTPVICPVTGEPTVNPDGLDGRVWNLMADGLHYRHAKESGELKRYLTASSNWHAAMQAPTGFHAKAPAGKWLQGPDDYLKQMFPHTGERRTSGRLEDYLKHGIIMLETDHNAVAPPYSEGVYIVELTEDEARLARLMVNGLMDTARAVIMPAYRAGQSLLMNIAGGNLSMEDMSKITAKIKD